jgi:hypothetical protein
MPFAAILDACVLVPMPLVDTLLRVAGAGLYLPLWSLDILNELERTLAQWPNVGPARATSRIAMMREAFPEAEVTGYDALVASMPVEQADQHVVAAALVGHAQVIVTSNLKHFPSAPLADLGLDVQDPDTFLCHHYSLDPPVVMQALHTQASDLQNPPITLDRLLRNLEVVVPQFVDEIRRNPP